MNRSTTKALAYNRMECVCDIKEISCRGYLCISEVYTVLCFFLLVSLLFFFVRCLFPMLQSFNSLMNWSSRGENGQLRVGVRRLAHQQSSMPSSVISSQSMHLGVLATASHAVSTQTLFVVYYKPRYQMLTFFLK